MNKQCVAANPFVLMMDPGSVLRAVERSERLQSLQRQVCRPLDKPILSGSSVQEGRMQDDDTELASDADDMDALPD